MSDTIARRTVTINNPQGLHARPAYMLAALAGKFDAKIEIIKDSERVDAKSILSIMTLAAEQGTDLDIEADGDDAQAAIDALVDLVEQKFPGDQATETTEQNS